MNSPLIIAKSEEESVQKTHGYSLVERMVTRHNVIAVSGEIPVDYTWVANGITVMGENKTISDFMQSHTSGHLTNQLMDMKGSNVIGFVLVEGDPLRDGDVVGPFGHQWVQDRWENVLLTLQSQGYLITYSPDAERTPRRLASIYEWTAREDHDGWLIPERVLPPVQDYADEDYRWKVGMLMHVGGRKGGLGQKKADDLMDAYGLMGALGITQEGLDAAYQRWLAVEGIGKKTADRWYQWLKS